MRAMPVLILALAMQLGTWTPSAAARSARQRQASANRWYTSLARWSVSASASALARSIG